MKKEVFISVIIPIFNAENFISHCLESILSQGYKSFEIILVNDGSTDNSGSICDYYSSLHQNILVIHQNNQGVSRARNTGLKNVKGEYICFVDADDYILPDYFKTINQLYHGCDIIRFEKTKYKYNNKIYNNFEFINDKYFSSALWVYIFKTEIIKKYQIEFSDSITHSEDFSFVVKAISISSRIKDCNIRFYQYQYNPNSAIHKALSHKAADSHLLAIIDIIKFLKQNNIFERKIYIKIINDFYFYFILLLKIPHKNLSYKHAKKTYKEFTKIIWTLCKDDLGIIYFKYKLPFIYYFIPSTYKCFINRILHKV